MDNEKKTCLCPILNKEIEGMECFDAALVFEFTDKNQEICLKCKYHPD